MVRRRRPAACATPSTPWVTAYVGIGSNIEPERHIRAALRRLRERFGELRLSPVYRSPAEGFTGNDFLNLVVAFDTREQPGAVIDFLERLHVEAGRVREAERFVSRTLDMDLLLYGDAVSSDLQLPRTDITDHAFVLGPLADLAPTLRHPVNGRTMQELWEAFDRERHPRTRVELAGA